MTFKKGNKELGLNASLSMGLVDDLDTTLKDKLECLKVFYVK